MICDECAEYRDSDEKKKNDAIDRAVDESWERNWS
jgi:hypothetical protein